MKERKREAGGRQRETSGTSSRFHKYLLSIYCVLGIISGTENTIAEQDSVPTVTGLPPNIK